MSGTLDDLKRRILARVPLAELIGEEVALKSKGGSITGCCPFHAEKTPSFHVYPDQHYYCFGCKVHGDAITWVRERQGLGYVEALRHLAQKFGVEAPELTEPRRASRDAPLYKILMEAQELFVRMLWSPHGEEARAYLRGRGYDDETIKALGFGLTPPEGFGLVRHLRQKGFRDEDMVTASVATQSSSGGKPYDFYIRRLMIPIRDEQGRIIAFGGRTMDGHHAKYVNARTTPLFDKGHTLYNLDTARKAMREKGRAIVVEGYMDALQLRVRGFGETVGVLGTAFNVDHLRLLARSTKLVYMLLDGDAAGRGATLDTVAVALAVPGVEVRAVRLPEGKDPDEYVQEHGPEGLEALLRKGQELVSFAIGEKLKDVHDLAVPELVSREFVPWLAKIDDALKRDFLAARIADLTGVDAALVKAQLADRRRAEAREARAVPSGGPQRAAAAAAAAATEPYREAPPLPLADFEAFGLLYHATPGELDVDVVERLAVRELTLEMPYQELLTEICAVLRSGETPAGRPLGAWQSAMLPENVKTIERLETAARAYANVDRATKLVRLFAGREEQRKKATIGRLTARLRRLQLARDPENDKEIQQILQSIQELSSRVAAPGD